MIVTARPRPDSDSQQFWDYLKQKEFRLQQCSGCGRFRFPPYPSCPHCGVEGGEWKHVSGQGHVYSWIVVHHPVDPRLKEDVPFIVGLIELEEGPRIVGRIIDIPHEKLRKDMPVKGTFKRIDDELTLLNFQSIE